jgi:hypothetical protein
VRARQLRRPGGALFVPRISSMLSGMRRAWGLVLGIGLVGIAGLAGCGDSDGDGNAPTGKDDGGMDSGAPDRKDSGPGDMDAGKDSGKPSTDGGIDGFIFIRDSGWDGFIFMPPTDAEPMCIFAKPAGWSCPDSFWEDGVCDCGCNGFDSCDCNQFSCAEPGCTEPTCGACNAADGTAMSCEAQPDPDDWKCAGSPQSADGLCDCGCGALDEACNGSGCSGSGCYRPYCDRRWNTSGASPVQITVNPFTAGWTTCALGAYGEDKPSSCDCGCGIHDADCDPLLDCTGAGCTNVGCNICHDVAGRVVPCDNWVAAWIGNANTSGSCDPKHYNEGDGVCDCGCGVSDPDCAPAAGTTSGAGSFAAECDRCVNQGNDPVGCNPPLEWTCYDQHYGTGDGCDCECGAPDPDCAGNGCATPGCSDSMGAACEYCWTDKDTPDECGSKWTCTANDSVNAWTSTSTCDCGCGTPDPACRFGDRPGCVGADCDQVPGCEQCNDAAGNRVACGNQWTDNSCSLDYYGDGRCDCGCGTPDPDCGAAGCSEKGCVAEGCEVCHSGAALIQCETWHCDAAKYDDGVNCDCGCGSMDPDCPSGHGCKEPGCHREASGVETCEACHDAFGRVVPCPT